MSYLALARKWRPRTFADVVGQGHVVRALENALDSGRVHHAYLFAGTRGVGKTTIARILAKALNCETGVTTTPCGRCAPCVGVDEGRFVDLIEVDAASRTGVEDTRELLENVQYTPTSGRFKVYLIDEVHMLSRQSFNALLKTLEEPPPHVKFLFATTDPQKLPVTVLSRCLQFNLKRLAANQIVDRMTAICAAEGLDAEPAALARIARSAAGSMRDALSLLDQAIAFGGGRLGDNDTAEMLGSMDHRRIAHLLDAIVCADGAELLTRVRELDELVPDYESVLDELATALQRIAVIQVAGEEAVEDAEYAEVLAELAGSMDPAFVQLLYQIAITSRRDLRLAPDVRLGFEMALLRMLAFRPDEGPDGGAAAESPGQASARTPGSKGRAAPTRARSVEPVRESSVSPAPATQAIEPAESEIAPPAAATEPVAADEIDDWPAFVAALALDGAARQLAENTALEAATPFELRLRIERRNEHLLTELLQERLLVAVQARVGQGIRLTYVIGDEPVASAAARSAEETARSLQNTRRVIQADPNIRDLLETFDAEVVPESIRPGAAKDPKNTGDRQS